jgi:adenosylhomocysteine nucleosidase
MVPRARLRARRMTKVAVIAAMAGELKPLVRGCPHASSNGVDLWRPGSGGWIAACAGAGGGAAARALAEAEREGPVDCVISTGWAGALNGDLAAGRAYRVSGVIDARTGERFPIPGESGDYWLVTSPRVAGQAEKRRLAAATGASLVDMEAAGLARLARGRGISFRCVKGISDGFGESLPDFNAFLTADGQFEFGRFIRFAALRPWLWPALLRIGKNGRDSAACIRDSLLDILENDR